MRCSIAIRMIQTAVELLVAMATAPTTKTTDANILVIECCPCGQEECRASAPSSAILIVESCSCGLDECCATPTTAQQARVFVIESCTCGQLECCQSSVDATPTILVIESCQCGGGECCQLPADAIECCPSSDDECPFEDQHAARIAVCFGPTADDTPIGKFDFLAPQDAHKSDLDETSEDEDHINEIVALLDNDNTDQGDEMPLHEALDQIADAFVEMAASISSSVTKAAHCALADLQQRAIDSATALGVSALKYVAWFAALWVKEYFKLTLEMEIEKARQTLAAESSKKHQPTHRCWW